VGRWGSKANHTAEMSNAERDSSRGPAAMVRRARDWGISILACDLRVEGFEAWIDGSGSVHRLDTWTATLLVYLYCTSKFYFT
jgi:hypothetical protein